MQTPKNAQTKKGGGKMNCEEAREIYMKDRNHAKDYFTHVVSCPACQIFILKTPTLAERGKVEKIWRRPP